MRVRSLAALLLALLLAVLGAGAPARAVDNPDHKVLVLGVDGLDPEMIRRFAAEGKLPNFARLIEQGDFKPLATSMPPLSPVAWSNFITGMDPGGHGIYDFIHRDPERYIPEFAMTETKPGRTVKVGHRCLPVTGGGPQLLRRGKAFWEILNDAGVQTRVFRIPVNFPPVETGHGLLGRSKSKALSGMGTPDILGTTGTFSYYATRPPGKKRITGGRYYPVTVVDHRVDAALTGPDNPTLCKRQALEVPFSVFLDPDESVARIRIGEKGDRNVVLREGEWSDWVEVEFTAVPVMASVTAVGRFYLKEVRPEFKLYVSPLQISPEKPALPISDPEDWSHELWEHLGFFYTQEQPEDTKALSANVLSGREFWDQAQFVYRERLRALDHFLAGFDRGLLFFYFSSIDQQSHMLWRYMDPAHPGHIEDDMLAAGIEANYRVLDRALGEVVASLDEETTLIVMSDHGFCPFYRGVNLNRWLVDQGYQTLKPGRTTGREFFVDVDWSKTQAYAVGLNGLYINMKGREAKGAVDPSEYQALLDRIERELLELVDPETGERAVTLVIQPRRDYHGELKDDGPDIIVGYNRGYRSSWESPLGESPRAVFVDNDQAWSGDHSVDYRHVPGTLIANRPITLDAPALYDLTVAILDEYGIEKPEEMIGEDCLGSR